MPEDQDEIIGNVYSRKRKGEVVGFELVVLIRERDDGRGRLREPFGRAVLAEQLLEFHADVKEELLPQKVQVGEAEQRFAKRERTLGEQAPCLLSAFGDR